MNAVNTKVMLLIDADNVSVDIVEQAVEHLLAEHGALHVRRAYCSAEAAAKHQALFKRLWIRPMVNLASGKNCTDIALAIDALDLVAAERPDVVVIASSDSDFAPLVARLREKGCRVCGIGQQGKTSDDTERVYDSYLQLAPRSAVAKRTRRTAAKAAPATKTAPRAPAASQSAAAAAVAAPSPAPAKARRTRKRTEIDTEVAAAAPPPKPRTPRSRKSPASASAPAAPSPPPVAASPPPPTLSPSPSLAPSPSPSLSPTPSPSPPPTPPAAVLELLRALPELSRGQTLDLQKAAEVLRRGGLLSRSSSALKLFGRHPDWFTLLPAADPRQVAVRRPGHD